MGGILPTGSGSSVLHSALTCTIVSGNQEVCTSPSDPFSGIGVGFLLVSLAIAVLGIVAGVKVLSKAGYSGWWILITFVPLVGVVCVFIFAFSEWPIQREVQRLRSRSSATPFTGAGAPWTLAGAAPAAAPRGATPADEAPMPSFGAFMHGESAAPPSQPPPGWYPAPEGPPGRLRYWDGSAWTEHRR